MTELSRSDFSADPRTADWRIVLSGACALYRTPDYRSAIELVDAVAGLATSSLEPEFEVRARAVLIRLPMPDRTMDHEHLELAAGIAMLAEQRGLTADPASIQDVQLAIDAADGDGIRAFWAAALGYEPIRESHLRSPDRIGPTVFISDKPYESPRNRIHVDISLPPDQAQQRIDAILAAGGRMLGDRYAPMWWSLIDAEGNVVDLATWRGRDDGD